MLHLHIAFAGFHRAPSATHRDFRRRLIRPVRRVATTFSASLTLNVSKTRVTNVRSGEDGFSEAKVPVFSSRQSTVVLDQAEIDEQINSTYLKARLNGNAWPGDDFASLKNALRFLFVLREAEKQIPDEAEVVLFSRPDLLILDRLKIDNYLEYRTPFLVTPSWHRWGGINDRVAIMSRDVVSSYFSRFNVLDEYLGSGNMFHSEEFLAFAVGNIPSYPLLVERFQRVRLGGIRQNEDFSL